MMLDTPEQAGIVVLMVLSGMAFARLIFWLSDLVGRFKSKE